MASDFDHQRFGFCARVQAFRAKIVAEFGFKKGAILCLEASSLQRSRFKVRLHNHCSTHVIMSFHSPQHHDVVR